MAIFSDISGMSTEQTLLLSLAIIVLIITVMNMRRRRPKDGSPKQYRREIDSATAQNAAIKRDMEALLIELEELSRKINAQVDTRFAKLEQSITDADRRVSALRILIDEAKRVQGEKDTESPAAPQRTIETATEASETAVAGHEAISRMDDEGPTPPTTDRRKRIYELADAGRSPVEIAREVGTQPGEVELILNLRLDPGR